MLERVILSFSAQVNWDVLGPLVGELSREAMRRDSHFIR